LTDTLTKGSFSFEATIPHGTRLGAEIETMKKKHVLLAAVGFATFSCSAQLTDNQRNGAQIGFGGTNVPNHRVPIPADGIWIRLKTL
jgi:hypothetical protein